MDVHRILSLDDKIQISSYIGQFTITTSIQVGNDPIINLIWMQLYLFSFTISICLSIKIQKYLG